MAIRRQVEKSDRDLTLKYFRTTRGRDMPSSQEFRLDLFYKMPYPI